MSVCGNIKLHQPWHPLVFDDSLKDSPQTAVEAPHLSRLMHDSISGRNQPELDVC